MKRTVVFDTETESLNLRLSRPWQLSYVICDDWKILEKHDYILDVPNFNISADAARTTKFSWDRYNARKEDPVPRLKQFQELMRDPDTTLVAHNGIGFDIYQLKNIYQEFGFVWDWDWMNNGLMQDSNCVAKALKENLPFPDRKCDILPWMFKLNNYHRRGLKTSVAFLLKEYDVPHDEKRLHDGLYDVEMTFEIHKRQKYERQLPV